MWEYLTFRLYVFNKKSELMSHSSLPMSSPYPHTLVFHKGHLFFSRPGKKTQGQIRLTLGQVIGFGDQDMRVQHYLKASGLFLPPGFFKYVTSRKK